MPGISDALIASANNLKSLEHGLSLIQSNVANASTPGYARQNLAGAESLTGGSTTHQQSARDEYAEQAVRQQTSLLGRSNQLVSVLRTAESVFGASADSGIPKAISNLFAAFSGLAVSPNDTSSRQLVLDRATQLGRSFNGAAKA